MKRLLTIAGLSLAASPAFAHHPLEGLPMETFAHGVMSGIGHPVLGFDHLFFVAAMGVAALFTANRLLTPAAYIGAMLVGCGLMYAGIAMPAAEIMIVASLLVLGGIILSGKGLSTTSALLVFALFGLFHGSAFGEAVAGDEGTTGGAVLVGYLIGLGVIQYLIAIGAGWAAQKLGATNPAAINARLGGAMVAGIGLFLALEVIEGPIVAALAG